MKRYPKYISPVISDYKSVTTLKKKHNFTYDILAGDAEVELKALDMTFDDWSSIYGNKSEVVDHFYEQGEFSNKNIGGYHNSKFYTSEGDYLKLELKNGEGQPVNFRLSNDWDNNARTEMTEPSQPSVSFTNIEEMPGEDVDENIDTLISVVYGHDLSTLPDVINSSIIQ